MSILTIWEDDITGLKSTQCWLLLQIAFGVIEFTDLLLVFLTNFSLLYYTL